MIDNNIQNLIDIETTTEISNNYNNELDNNEIYIHDLGHFKEIKVSCKNIDIYLDVNMKSHNTIYFNNFFDLDLFESLKDICSIKGPFEFSIILFKDTEILINEGLAYNL